MQLHQHRYAVLLCAHSELPLQTRALLRAEKQYYLDVMFHYLSVFAIWRLSFRAHCCIVSLFDRIRDCAASNRRAADSREK